ncbi:hypothetical protein Y1Q_0021503 [Alligator mississippiensis]|uniref:Uncharacterized protein n=1 Tax=Alligator mississippiensis TaxID=8496 RepID=A0A151P9U9_ALLMI|nr:hypothetical protein Y1Q_0021503 [Alligator mississippiensis]
MSNMAHGLYCYTFSFLETLSCEKGSLKALMVCQAEALKNFGPGSSTQSMVCYSAYRGKFFNVLMTDSQISAYTHFYH